MSRGVDLLLFAGGDGTARDVVRGVGDAPALLGIPSGVKMHSGVFATSPESAGDAAARFLAAPDAVRACATARSSTSTRTLDGAMRRDSTVSLRVPDVPRRVQPMKAAAPRSDEAALAAVCASIADGMDPRRLYLLGPGTTTRRCRAASASRRRCSASTPCGPAGSSPPTLDERAAPRAARGRPATLVLGVVGGQGALLGRGNQQLSPAVIRRDRRRECRDRRRPPQAPRPSIPPVLHVDTGDPALDEELCGYRRVHVAPGRTLVSKVAA